MNRAVRLARPPHRSGASLLGALAGALTTWAAPAIAAPADAAAAPSSECNRPVLMVVWIDDLDRNKSKAYGEALRRSQIVKRYGGSYEAVSPPALVLEGDWPESRGFVIERYPCLEAVKRFWYSDEYQKEIKPLREGSGRYVVAVFEERAATPAADPILTERLATLPKTSPWPAEYFQPREDVRGAERPASLPEPKARSIDAQALAASARVSANAGGRALLVWRRGQLEFAQTAPGFSLDEPFNSFHMHWLPLVLATGIAVRDGQLGIDDPVSRYLPEWAGDARGRIRVRDLLQMAAGLELYKDSVDPATLPAKLFFGGNREAAILAWPREADPGQSFEYNYIVPEVLGLVLERATRTRYAPYLSRVLWQPLGNRTAQVWLDRPGGFAYRNAAFFASARDWLRLGELLAMGGKVGGREVVPASWIREATTPSKPNRNFGFLSLGSPHLPERRLSPRVNYYSRVGEPFERSDVIIVDGYLHRLFAVPSAGLVVLHVGSGGRVTAEQRAGWDDAALLNPILRGLR